VHQLDKGILRPAEPGRAVEARAQP